LLNHYLKIVEIDGHGIGNRDSRPNIHSTVNNQTTYYYLGRDLFPPALAGGWSRFREFLRL
jgi:hypothetical protein